MQNLQKFLPDSRVSGEMKSPSYQKNQLFHGFYRKKQRGFSGDITRKRLRYFQNMHPVMHRGTGDKPDKFGKTTVEKPKFSTLSTDLSTGVVHSEETGSVSILVNISFFDNFQPFSYFFVRQNVDETEKTVQKIRLDRRKPAKFPVKK